MEIPLTTFVFRDVELCNRLTAATPAPDPDDVPEWFFSGAWVWTIRTYLELRRRGLPVELAPRCRRGGVNVVFYDHLRRYFDLAGAFVVVVQPDRPPARVGNMRIVQSPATIRSPSDILLPHWPQAALMPRDRGRGSTVERLGYFGRAHNLHPGFQSADFRRELARLGVELVLKETPWNDYSDVDAVLAVRHAHELLLQAKPPSKLVNAWAAGCPAILGVEPGFRALRRSDLDYLEVTSPADALEAVRKLQGDADLYGAIVENGFRRFEDWDSDAVARRWQEVLGGPVLDAYRRWSSRSSITTAGDYLSLPFRVGLHYRTQRAFESELETIA